MGTLLVAGSLFSFGASAQVEPTNPTLRITQDAIAVEHGLDFKIIGSITRDGRRVSMSCSTKKPETCSFYPQSGDLIRINAIKAPREFTLSYTTSQDAVIPKTPIVAGCPSSLSKNCEFTMTDQPLEIVIHAVPVVNTNALTCYRTAVSTRERKIAEAFTANNTALQTALATRAERLDDIWANTLLTPLLRIKYIAQVWVEFKNRPVAGTKKWLQDRQRDAMNQFQKDIRNCKAGSFPEQFEYL